MSRTTALLVFLLLVGAVAFSQTSVVRGGHGNPNKTDEIKADQIKLTLKSSRTQINSDTSFSISAEIENASPGTIFITPTFLTLTVPPEVDPAFVGGASEWRAFLPGTGENDELRKIVAVQPGSRTVAVFSLQNNPSQWQRFRAALRLVPGEYTIHVACAYWNNLEDAQQQRLNYSTQVAETNVPFVVPPIAILPGAALGGLLAFILLPSLWLPPAKRFGEHRWYEKVSILGSGLGVSCLLSVVVTILLSRISESQFLVRVSVQDTWGAVAIGFIAGASGTSVLQRFNLSQARKINRSVEGGVAGVGEENMGHPDVAGSAELAKAGSSTPVPRVAA